MLTSPRGLMAAILSVACLLGAATGLANAGDPVGSTPDVINQDIAITEELAEGLTANVGFIA
ncbi:MAG: hypothetical protein WBA51_03975 [Erythrobacter sp.]